jgi:hypothetical protein
VKCDDVQVVVLSEGYQLYFGSPESAPTWFDWGLGYPYDPDRDGSVSDWLIDLISISFQKPKDFAERWAFHLRAGLEHFLILGH